MVPVAASIACHEVTAIWSFIWLLPAPAQTMAYGEGSSDRLEVALACLGDLPDSIGATSPGIWGRLQILAQLGEETPCLLAPFFQLLQNTTFAESHQIVSALVPAAWWALLS